MEVPIWLERDFCESDRKVGQEIDFAALLETRQPVSAANGPHMVEVEEDGEVRVVGTKRGTAPGMSRSQLDVVMRLARLSDNPVPSTEAARLRTITLVESGPLRFGIWGSHTPSTIECRGWLRELTPRTGPSGVDKCHGVIKSIIWHKEIVKTTKVRDGVESSEGVGYHEGTPISSTSAAGFSHGDFEFIVQLADQTTNDGV